MKGKIFLSKIMWVHTRIYEEVNCSKNIKIVLYYKGSVYQYDKKNKGD